MTILSCMQEVMDAVKVATADLHFEPPDAEDAPGGAKPEIAASIRDPVPLHYYPQQLPRLVNNDRFDPFPYVIIRMLDGVQSRSPDAMSEYQIVILVGVRHSDPENTAYADAAQVVDRITSYFAIHPETKHFLLSANTMEWGLNGDEDSWPYSGAFVVTRWQGVSLTHEEEEYV